MFRATSLTIQARIRSGVVVVVPKLGVLVECAQYHFYLSLSSTGVASALSESPE
jgi:hypothetical protein